MTDLIGGWYLSGSTLQYRKLDTDETTLTNTVLASITGLTGLKMEDGVVKVNRGSGSWSAITDNDITVEETAPTAANPEADPPVAAAPGKINFKIGKSILGSSNISVNGSNDYKAYMDFIDESQKVHIDGTETIIYNNSAGTATIIGDLTAGFTLNKLDGTATSATYNSGKTNQTLATITGLQKNYTAPTEENAVTTVNFKESQRDSDGVVTAGYITLSKVSDVTGAPAGTVSALGTSNISVNNQTIATNNGINYYLKLGGTAGDYVQKDATDEAAYWTVKGTTATYQYYSPTGYQLTDSSNNIIDNTASDYSTNQTKATKIKVTAAKTTTVVTVTGLAQNLTTNATDTKIATAKSSVTNTRSNSIADQVGSGQARTGTSADATFVPGITVKSGPSGTSNKPTYKTGTTTLDTNATNSGKGSVAINITRSVLPASGTVTVTPGSAFTATVTANTTEGTNDFYTTTDKDDTTKVKNQRIWVINGNTAIYKEVDLAYYEVQDTTANGVTKIVCTAQTVGTVLATIRGLNEDWLANEDNLTRSDEVDATKKDTGKVITAIKGITFTKEAGYDYDTNGKPKAKTGEVGEITLSSEVLGQNNVTIDGSNNFKLALLATTDSSAGTAVTLPTFSNYKWNLNNTTATLKGDITAGYWAADNGKTINYTATAQNQTLATVTGLKSGTQLNSSSNDTRTIGNYTSTTAGEYGTFTEGVKIDSSNTLAHKDTAGEKTLTRMPITISKHVLGTSQIGLTSNFFTLALDKTIADGATDAQKIASKTYVLEKAEAEAAADTIDWHGSLGSTSTLKKSTPAYYTLGDADTAGTVKKITYTKPGTATTVATVKGLNSAITENDIAFDTTNHVITIKTANALTTSNVTIENPKDTADADKYKLALEPGVTALGEATLSDKTWKQNGTTLSYTAKVTGAGYKLNNDANIITYTKEATSTPTTLATITGIRAGLVTDTAGVMDSSTDNETKFSSIPGVTFDPKAGTVTLTKAALNSANVKLSGNGNYKLLINTDSSGNAITLGSENYIVTTEPDPKQIWVISGSTATYKTVIPEYYKYDATANTLTYVKPADAKYQSYYNTKANYADKTLDENKDKYDNSGNGKTMPALGQIKGLKSNLVVSADGQKIGYYDSTGTFKEAITVGTKNASTGETAITIKDDYVLDYKNNVTLDNTAINNGYRIYLDTTAATGETESLADKIKPALDLETAAPAWTVSNGTATYKGTTKSGYANSSDGKSIIFTQGKSNVEIAKITGLKKTGLTSITGTNDLVFGTRDDDANVITVYGNVLTNSDVNLTTSIAVLGKDYKLAIDSTSVSEKSDVDTTGKKIWTVSGTTATYGTYKEDYYSLNNADGEASNKITYHAAGVAEEDQLAVVTGLASGLIASKVGDEDDQIRGITVTDQEEDSTADPAVVEKHEILLSSTVLPTSPTATGNNPTVITLTNKNSAAYKLAIDSSVVEPEDDNLYEAKNQSNGQTADLTITNITTAGYTLDTDKTTLTYKAQTTTGTGLIAKITGLKPNLTKNANGDIEGIAVDKTNETITLTKAVLTNSNVELPTDSNPTGSTYKLKLATTTAGYSADEVPSTSSTGYGWKKDATTAGKFELRSGTATSGYTLSTDGKKVTYTGGNDDGNPVATITGLDKATLTGTEIGGITVSEATDSNKKTITITVSTDALSGKDIVITPSDTSNTYKLALNGVEASKTTSTWSVNKGTATYKQEFSEGYEVITDEDGKSYKIKYTPKGTITSTLTGLSQENLKVTALEEDASGNKANKLYSSVVTTTSTVEDGGESTTTTTNTYYGIDFANGVFTVTDSDALAHKAVALKTSVSGTGLKDPGYTLALGNDKDLKVGTTTNPVSIEATVKDPVWVKDNTTTTATYTQETASGYSLSGNEKNITYSTDPKFVNLATVSNLKKDVTLSDAGKIVTTATDGTTSETDGIAVTTAQRGTNNGVITVYTKDLFDGKNVSIANSDKYEFASAVDTVPTATKVWSISGSTATYKNVTPAYYSFAQVNGADNKKSIVYNKQADYKGENGTDAAELTKISGLKSGVKLDSEGYVLDSNGEKTSTQGLKAGSNKVTLSAAVLGTSNVTSDNYTLGLDGVLDDSTEATEWVGDGTTYKYKKYTKAYYLLDPNGNMKVTYTAAQDIETYAKITGLAKDLVDNGKDATEASTSTAIGFSGNVSNGGTITLGATQLNGVTGTVKLTSTNGKFKLALDTTSADNKVTESITTPADAWTTSGTTATLKGFKSAGYTLNDSGDTITYQKEGTKGDGGNKTEVTVATVKGLKSGATIVNSDVTAGTGDDAGTKIITLKLSQLGTSNVTLTGDGYKLALDADATSANDTPKWVKATNATKATYSQNNYNGFTVSADGKTLNYWKSKNNNVDLATINGLAKDVTEDQMGVTTTTGETTLTDKLVVINTTDKTITIKKEALGSNTVTLNKNDDYTLQLDTSEATEGKVGGKEITDQIVYDKNAGKASIVSGTTEYWEQQTDGKTLKHTAAKFTTKAEITGLPKTLTYTEADGTNDATLAGITVSDDKITVSSDAVAGFVNNNAITLSNKTYKDTNGANQTAAYKLTLGTGLTEVPSSPDKKEWTLSGTTLTLKELTSAGYTLSSNDTKLTYSAAKTGSELARLTFTGLANGIITKQADGNIYVGDTTNSDSLAIEATMNDQESKDINIKQGLINAIEGAGNATTITLTTNKGYKLYNSNFTGQTPAMADPDITTNSFSKTATNGTVTFKRTTPAGWTHTDTKVQYTKEASADAGTISGINKTFTFENYGANNGDLQFTLPTTGETVGTITVGETALTNSNVTFSKVNGGNDYTLVLADAVLNDNEWQNTTGWVNNNGTANYKTYNDEHWAKDTTKNQINYTRADGGKSYAQISGMSKTASIVAADVTDDGVITLHQEDLGTSKVTLSITKVSSVSNADLDAKITAGNDTASAFKLALGSDVNSLLSSVKDAVWDNNGTVATLTGTIKKGYKLSNDQKSVTYQSADKKLQQIAKVSGIKKDSQITDDNVSLKSVNSNLKVQEITLTPDHLGTSNVQLTGEGYKLALSSDVLIDGEETDNAKWKNQTEWVNNNGTFTYKTYDKIHYKLNDAGTQVQYIAAKDDSTNSQHKTFAQITGLAKSADATAIDFITDTSNNNTVAKDGVISLTSDLLNKANIKLTDNQTSGYTLSMDNVNASLKSTVSDFNASVSGTGTNIKADWVGTQGKGYFLNNDMQNITYYSAAKTNQTIAKVTGLASTVTSDNNDAFSAAYTASTNIVALGADSLGSSVTVSGTAAFNLGDGEYKDAQIVGSGSADKLTVSGSNLSINAGGGNDIVDLTGASGSTFLYANGNGNDIITNFGSDRDNKIKITNVAKTNITVQTDTKNTADTIVKVNTSTIRVKGVTSGVNVIDKDGVEVSYTDPANVLADDNYAMTPQNTSADEDYAMSPNLSSIVKGATSSYTADDLATDDATSLAKQSTAVSYSGKK